MGHTISHMFESPPKGISLLILIILTLEPLCTEGRDKIGKIHL